MKKMRLIALAVLAPYLVGFTPTAPDSSWTEVGFALGRGSYDDVVSGCSANKRYIDVPFTDLAVSVDHYTSDLHLGLKAGGLKEDAGTSVDPAESRAQSFGYVTPLIGLN